MTGIAESADTFTVFTFSPIDIPIQLRPGFDNNSAEYLQMCCELASVEHIRSASGASNSAPVHLQSEYVDLNDDVREMQICTVSLTNNDVERGSVIVNPPVVQRILSFTTD